MFGVKNVEEAKLYYLYMMADGEVSVDEEKLFDEICKELRVSKDDKQILINECKEMLLDSKSSLDVIVEKKIEENIGRFLNASETARIMWNLVNLGYADGFYSEEEKEVVNYLMGKWKIDISVYQEMVDTSDTILSLTKQKEWLVSTLTEGSLRDEKEKKIDAEISNMLSDVKLTIAELTM